MNQTNSTKVQFKKIGNNNKHEVTLLELHQFPFDLEQNLNITQSYWEKKLTDYWNQANNYLKEKGFDDTNGYFKATETGVSRWIDGEDDPLSAMPLFGAIEERDKKNNGQTGEYLAALINHQCLTLKNLLNDFKLNNKIECFGAIIDTALLIQEYFFNLKILDDIHPQYSAGTGRSKVSHNLRQTYEKDAEEIFRYLRKTLPKHINTKENCYKKTHEELKNRHQNEDVPAAETIKDWFRSRKDLP